MSEHTPGPWQANSDPIYHRGKPELIWGPEGPGHGAVCQISPGNLGTPAEQAANARLIAAAPEMFKLLDQFVTACLYDHPDPAAVALAYQAEALLMQLEAGS